MPFGAHVNYRRLDQHSDDRRWPARRRGRLVKPSTRLRRCRRLSMAAVGDQEAGAVLLKVVGFERHELCESAEMPNANGRAVPHLWKRPTWQNTTKTT